MFFFLKNPSLVCTVTGIMEEENKYSDNIYALVQIWVCLLVMR